MSETNATTKVLIATKRTPSTEAEVVRAGGGLVTMKIDAPTGRDLEVGRAIAWSTDAPGARGTVGSIVSAYDAGGSRFLVVSPRAHESAAPAKAPRMSPAPTSASLLRLRPAADEVIVATMRDAAHEWEVRVRELSIDGATLFLGTAGSTVTSATYRIGAALEVSIPLQDAERRARFVGRVVRSTPLTRGVAIGVRFDTAAPDHPEQLRALRSHLLSRQRRATGAR